MASTKLTRTFSADSNRKKFTVSVWVKKSQHASAKVIWGGEISTGYVWLNMGSTLYFQQNPSSTIEFNSNAQFRDPSGWYHIVQQVDTAQATASNRMKFWVNGEQITDWATSTYPSQNEDIKFQSAAYPLRIGEFGNSYWDGSMSHFHWCDGYAYQASDFGETDATTGEWKIKTSPSVSYGTNGFFILKDGNSVTDQSPNTNNFTVAAGNLTKTEDCPSNVFCTFNPLDTGTDTGSLLNGNTSYSQSQGDSIGTIMGTKGGKWYWEAKIGSGHGGAGANDSNYYFGACFLKENNTWATNHGAMGICNGGNQSNTFALYNNTGSGSITQPSVSPPAAGTIVGIAVDMSGGTSSIKWFFNGTEVGSITGITHTDFLGCTVVNQRFTGTATMRSIEYNFGNGYFGTTAVSSAGTNASNLGIFEYDVPSGHTALCTKGLNL